MHNGAWIETFTGRRFYPLDPQPGDICVEDIAHALSLTTRFTGHTREFYSVAEHSVRVSRECTPEDALWGLLHDASEAFISDVSRPLKYSRQMDAYRRAERNVMKAVCAKFELPQQEPPAIKTIDNRMLVTEKRDLMYPSSPWAAFVAYEPYPERIVPWTPRVAECAFLARFFELAANQNLELIGAQLSW